MINVKIKKHHLCGNVQGLESIEIMRFLSYRHATDWMLAVNRNPLKKYLVTDLKEITNEDYRQYRKSGYQVTRFYELR